MAELRLDMSDNPMDRGPVIAAGLAMAATGALFYNLLPLILGVAQDDRGLDESQLGLLSAAFFLGYNLVSASAFFWIRHFDWRKTGFIAAVTALIGLGLASQTSGFVPLLVSVAVAGGGFSALYGLATTTIGDTTHPARWYGVKISLEALLGVLLLIILPTTLIASFGFAGVILGIALAILVFLPLYLAMPRRGRKVVSATGGEALSESRAGRALIWCALIGCLLFFGGQTTVWAFVERMGNAAGFDPSAMAMVLSLTLVFAVGGSAVAAGLGDRFGNLLPFFVSCLVFFTGVYLLSQPETFAVFAAGGCAVMFSVGLGITYCVSEIARLDFDGRHVVLSVPAIGLGAMLGPGIAGFIAESAGYGQVLIFGSLGVAIALLLFGVIWWYRDTETSRAVPTNG